MCGTRSSSASPASGIAVLGDMDIWIGCACTPSPASARPTVGAVVQTSRCDGPSSRIEPAGAAEDDVVAVVDRRGQRGLDAVLRRRGRCPPPATPTRHARERVHEAVLAVDGHGDGLVHRERGRPAAGEGDEHGEHGRADGHRDGAGFVARRRAARVGWAWATRAGSTGWSTRAGPTRAGPTRAGPTRAGPTRLGRPGLGRRDQRGPAERRLGDSGLHRGDRLGVVRVVDGGERAGDRDVAAGGTTGIGAVTGPASGTATRPVSRADRAAGAGSLISAARGFGTAAFAAGWSGSAGIGAGVAVGSGACLPALGDRSRRFGDGWGERSGALLRRLRAERAASSRSRSARREAPSPGRGWSRPRNRTPG